MRSRNVEALDAAMPAEAMLRRAGIERVFDQVVGSRQQAEPRSRHDHVQVPGHAAYRAVAVERFDLGRSLDLETNAAAMAAAAMDDMGGVRGRTHPRSLALAVAALVLALALTLALSLAAGLHGFGHALSTGLRRLALAWTALAAALDSALAAAREIALEV